MKCEVASEDRRAQAAEQRHGVGTNTPQTPELSCETKPIPPAQTGAGPHRQDQRGDSRWGQSCETKPICPTTTPRAAGRDNCAIQSQFARADRPRSRAGSVFGVGPQARLLVLGGAPKCGGVPQTRCVAFGNAIMHSETRVPVPPSGESRSRNRRPGDACVAPTRIRRRMPAMARRTHDSYLFSA